MMTKKKSNSWARLKLLWLLPVAALSMYAFAHPDGTHQLEQITRSDSIPITPTNQNYTLEFFEAELNKYISEQGGNTSLSSEEKINFLVEKANFVGLLVNFNDMIMFNNVLCPIEQLAAELSKKLTAVYPNKKPVLINFTVDLGTSAEVKNKIMQIVGDVFAENEELFKQKKQPMLLLYGIPKNYYSIKIATSRNKNND